MKKEECEADYVSKPGNERGSNTAEEKYIVKGGRLLQGAGQQVGVEGEEHVQLVVRSGHPRTPLGHVIPPEDVRTVQEVECGRLGAELLHDCRQAHLQKKRSAQSGLLFWRCHLLTVKFPHG
jgi:hypothetical protein